MGGLISAILGALFKVLIGWWWNKRQASEADKAEAKIAAGEAKIGEANEQTVNQENQIVAATDQVVDRVRTDDSTVDGSGLRDGANAINDEIKSTHH